MIALNDKTLRSLPAGVTVPAYDRSKVRPGIVHIGVGNFHRVHQANAIDDCLALGGNDGWGICGVGLTTGEGGRRKAEAYAAQDNLYSITELTAEMPSPVRVVGSIVEYLHAPSDPQAVLDRLAHPDTRIVSLTITEGGYNIDEASGEFRLDEPDVAHDLAGGTPRTVFGFLVSALAARRKAGLPPFTIMSCDNLRRNGDTSRKAVVSFARTVDSALADWIDREGAFPNSMVDRIAPQVPESDRLAINAASGIDDLVPATCETFTAWVMEDRFCAGRPPLEKVGVEFSDNVAAYVEVKGRLSNAAHMLMCYPSILLGHRYVHEGMGDARIPKLLRNFWTLDSMRLVTPPAGYSVQTFLDKVIERFANPAIVDRLLRVAGDGAAKINVFHGKTIEVLTATGADPTREAFLFASFWQYLHGVDDKGVPFEVVEPQIKDEDWALIRSADPVSLLKIGPFHGFGLAENDAFRTRYLQLVDRLRSIGAGATLDEILV